MQIINMNEEIEIFNRYENNKEDFLVLLDKLMSNLNNIYRTSFSTKDLTNQEIFCLYNCYYSYMLKKKNNLVKTKYTIKTFYLPMFFSTLALISSISNFGNCDNVIEVLLGGVFALMLFILLYYKGIAKEVKMIDKNQDREIIVKLIENLKYIKYTNAREK